MTKMFLGRDLKQGAPTIDRRIKKHPKEKERKRKEKATVLKALRLFLLTIAQKESEPNQKTTTLFF